jgi:hypothetical protein
MHIDHRKSFVLEREKFPPDAIVLGFFCEWNNTSFSPLFLFCSRSTKRRTGSAGSVIMVYYCLASGSALLFHVYQNFEIAFKQSFSSIFSRIDFLAQSQTKR